MTPSKTFKKYLLFLNGLPVRSQATVFCQHLKSITSRKKNHKTIYASDGGLNYILSQNLKFQKIFWVGDGDSLNTKAQNFLNTPTFSHKNFPQNSLTIEKYLLNKKKI